MIKKVLIRSSLLIIVFLALTVTAFAWFALSEDFDPQVEGCAVTGYFYDGNGSKEHPYQLKNQTHVYNLAWLQYMGYLNEEKDGKITQYYFELIDDIDMNGIIIPPIGTSEHPFVGHFDGNGYCISNLTVSNYLDDGERDFGVVTRPLSVTAIDEAQVSIVGFFGVVGAINDDIKNKIVDDSAVENIVDKVNSVHDLFLDNLTVRTETAKSLIGLFAGYVNGSVTNIGIGNNSTIHVGQNVMTLTGEDAFDMSYQISTYSLIGKYDTDNVFWEDKPTGGLVDDGGGNEGWGGSLDMYEIIRRASYMFTENIKKSPKNSYPVTFYNYGNIYYTYTNATNRQTAYIAKTSLLPINADTETMFVGNDTLISTSYPTNDYYSSHSSEIVASNNTGYIVGGGTSASNAWIRMRIEPMANGTYGGIYKSIGTGKTATPTFSRTNFEMLTIDKDGKVYVIKDDYNINASTAVGGSGTEKTHEQLGFKQYEAVVSSLSETMTGKTMVYGLRFHPTSKDGVTIENNTVASATTVADISMFGNTYSNYELIDGAINFKVKSQGIITTVAGTFAASSGDHSFFNLIEVTRDSSNKITGARVIEKIWVKYSGEKITDIQYNDDLADTTGYTQVYSEEKMNTLSSTQTAYYFELPVKAGDYALGALKGSSTGAYLMYLDIGANGDQSSDDSTTTLVPTHTIKEITFVDDAAIAAGSTAGYSVVTFQAIMGDTVTAHMGLEITFNRSSKTDMTYSVTDSSQAFTVKPVKDDDDLTVQKE